MSIGNVHAAIASLLSVGSPGNVHSAVANFTPSGCVPATEATFPGTHDLFPAGTLSRCPPQDFIVFNTNPDGVTIQWTVRMDSEVAGDNLVFSNNNSRLSGLVNPPEKVFASLRSVLGYKVHKGSPGFFPVGTFAGDGNCIADEATLTAGVTQFTDSTVLVGSIVAYRVSVVFDDGL